MIRQARRGTTLTRSRFRDSSTRSIMSLLALWTFLVLER